MKRIWLAALLICSSFAAGSSEEVVFYDESFDENTAYLNSFYPCPVFIWGYTFPSAETAYQAAKFRHHPDLIEKFVDLSAEDAWKLSRSKVMKPYVIPGWLSERVEIMKEVLFAKFLQNPHLQEKLLLTNDAKLIEHNPRKGKDPFWTDDHDGTGKNMQGELLMIVRKELSN